MGANETLSLPDRSDIFGLARIFMGGIVWSDCPDSTKKALSAWIFIPIP